MSKKVAMFAAAGKFLKKFMLIYLYKSSFLFFSIPKFSLKSWVPPLFLKIFPLLFWGWENQMREKSFKNKGSNPTF